MSLSKSKIFPDKIFYAWNPLEGFCQYEGCSVQKFCWSNSMKKRFNKPTKFQLNPDKLNATFPKEPSNILVCWNNELFQDRVSYYDIRKVIQRTTDRQHRYFFLSKNPSRYANFAFPDNCWLGTTITGVEDSKRIFDLKGFQIFVSIEPLLSKIPQEVLACHIVDWVIIGRLTRHGHKHDPKREWIQGIVDECKLVGIPLYLKNSLQEIWGGTQSLKEQGLQEFPKEEKS